MIEHLVISGGGILGITEFAILYNLYKEKFWEISNIKSIYGTSIGTVIGAILLFDIDIETIHDYILHRPWEKSFNVPVDSIIDFYRSKGILDDSIIRLLIEYLMEYKSISKDITLQELFELSHVDFYLYTIDARTFKTVELSHKSHPELPLLKAIYMSCCYPFIFKPVWYDNTYYIDGGLKINNPINPCVQRTQNTDSILFINTVKYVNDVIFEEDMDCLSYYLNVLKVILNNQNDHVKSQVENEVIVPYKSFETSYLDTLLDKKKRLECFQTGIRYSALFLLYKQNNKCK